MILTQDEMKWAVVDYLAARGVSTEPKQVAFTVARDGHVDVYTSHVFNVEIPLKEGPYR